MKAFALLLSAIILTACGSEQPSFERIGQIAPGGALNVANSRGNVNVFAPSVGQPKSQWTFQAFGPGTVRVVQRGNVVRIDTQGGNVRELVRSPKGVTLNVSTHDGALHVEDVDSIVNATDVNGDVKMLVPEYANAKTDVGNISVIFGSTTWDGTLHFSTRKGDVELYVNENAAARLHLHTDHGTIFTDFPLHGSSHGTSETIDAPINGGASRAIDVRVRDGSIRVLQLKPQI